MYYMCILYVYMCHETLAIINSVILYFNIYIYIYIHICICFEGTLEPYMVISENFI